MSAYEPDPRAVDYWTGAIIEPLMAVGARVYATEISQYGTILKRTADLGSFSVTYEVRLLSGGVLWFFPSTLEEVSDLEYLAAAMELP